MEDHPVRVMGMAKVSSGWASGTLQVTVGSTTAAVPLDDVTSAIVVAIRTAEVLRALGVGTAQPYATEAGVVGWACSSDFAYGASGTIRTRMGLASVASGTNVVGTGAHLGGWYPDHGLAMDGPMIRTTAAPTMADGSGSARLQPASSTINLAAYADLADVWTLEDDLGQGSIWDVWAGGRWRGRLRVEEVERVREGRAAAHAMLKISAKTYFDIVQS